MKLSAIIALILLTSLPAFAESPDGYSPLPSWPQTHEARLAATKSIIHTESLSRGISSRIEAKILQTILCENKELDPTIQSGYYQNGVREESYGLAQINLPSNKDVSYSQATDPAFAIAFIVKGYATHQQAMWTCAR